jgi:hypothetical protein
MGIKTAIVLLIVIVSLMFYASQRCVDQGGHMVMVGKTMLCK